MHCVYYVLICYLKLPRKSFLHCIPVAHLCYVCVPGLPALPDGHTQRLQPFLCALHQAQHGQGETCKFASAKKLKQKKPHCKQLEITQPVPALLVKVSKVKHACCYWQQLITHDCVKSCEGST